MSVFCRIYTYILCTANLIERTDDFMAISKKVRPACDQRSPGTKDSDVLVSFKYLFNISDILVTIFDSF